MTDPLVNYLVVNHWCIRKKSYHWFFDLINAKTIVAKKINIAKQYPLTGPDTSSKCKFHVFWKLTCCWMHSSHPIINLLRSNFFIFSFFLFAVNWPFITRGWGLPIVGACSFLKNACLFQIQSWKGFFRNFCDWIFSLVKMLIYQISTSFLNCRHHSYPARGDLRQVIAKDSCLANFV